MKLLAGEVVCQFALDTVSELPKDSFLFVQRIERVQEQFDNLKNWRIFLSERDAFETKLSYVRQYTGVMRSYARRRRRTLPLAVAVLFCIAVEKTAMTQIGGIST